MYCREFIQVGGARQLYQFELFSISCDCQEWFDVLWEWREKKTGGKNTDQCCELQQNWFECNLKLLQSMSLS